MKRLFSAFLAVLFLGTTLAEAGRASTEHYGGLYGAGGCAGPCGGGGTKLDP